MIQGVMPLLGYFMTFFPVFFEDFAVLYTKGFMSFEDKGWRLAEVR